MTLNERYLNAKKALFDKALEKNIETQDNITVVLMDVD